MISYITDIYENASAMTKYELQFSRTDIKKISMKKISQIMYKIASNNCQQNRCAYSMQKIIQVVFSQGHPKFGRTRGIQGTCISFFSILFSIFKAVSRWNKHDIEYAKEKGVLYTNCRTQISYYLVHGCQE